MAPKPVPPNLICVAHLTRRSTDQKIEAALQLAPEFDNEFARAVVQRKVLENLAVAAFPGVPGARARYENERYELLRVRNWPPPPARVESVLDQAYEAGLTEGARVGVRDIAPFIWRPATEFDL